MYLKKLKNKSNKKMKMKTNNKIKIKIKKPTNKTIK